MIKAKTCPCGSGFYRQELYDARGIFCCFYCDECEDEKKSRYRQDVLDDPNYWHDEDIESD